MNWISRWWTSRRRPPWLILDDFFPNLLTGFRVAEYNAYLRADPALRVLSAYPHFDAEWARYRAAYPQLATRVEPYSAEKLAGCRLAYVNFLNNAAMFLDELERHRLPFVLTLYPGGGFGLDEPESDAKLARVLGSKLLRHVVTTQAVTTRYVEARLDGRVPVSEIFGVVANPAYFDAPAERAYYRAGKAGLDICFVAEKYMPRGENKGYPAFIEAAVALARECPEASFHVVGSFTEHDLDVSPLAGRLRFHGRLDTPELMHFFHDMDVIVSPNRPFLLHPGNFDGFPTGCCVEASLCGVAVIASDPLALNHGRYRDGQDMLISPPDAVAIVERVRELCGAPQRISAIGRAGRETSRRLFDPANQIARRKALIDEQLL